MGCPRDVHHTQWDIHNILWDAPWDARWRTHEVFTACPADLVGMKTNEQ